MGRPAMVTRSIPTTVATVMVVDVTSGVTEKRDIEIPRHFKDDKKLLTACKKVVESDTVKVVAIIAKTEKKDLYGMTESDFLANAKILTADRKFAN